MTIAFLDTYSTGTSFNDHAAEVSGSGYSVNNTPLAALTDIAISGGKARQAPSLSNPPNSLQFEVSLASALTTLASIEISLDTESVVPYSETIVSLFKASEGWPGAIQFVQLSIQQLLTATDKWQVQGTVVTVGAANTSQVTINDFSMAGEHVVRFETGPTWLVLKVDGIVVAVADEGSAVGPDGSLDTLTGRLFLQDDEIVVGSVDYLQVDDVSAAASLPDFWTGYVKTVEA